MSEETGRISEKVVRVVETRTLEDGTIQKRFVTEKRVIIECSDWAEAEEEMDTAAVNKTTDHCEPRADEINDGKEEEEMAEAILSSDQAVDAPKIEEQRAEGQEKEDKAEEIAEETEAEKEIERTEIGDEDTDSSKSPAPSIASPSLDSDKENVDPCDKKKESMEESGETIESPAPSTPSMQSIKEKSEFGVPSGAQEHSDEQKKDSQETETKEQTIPIIPSTPISLLCGKRKSLFGASARRSPSPEPDNTDEEMPVEGAAGEEKEGVQEDVEMGEEVKVSEPSDDTENAELKEDVQEKKSEEMLTFEIQEPFVEARSEEVKLVEVPEIEESPASPSNSDNTSPVSPSAAEAIEEHTDETPEEENDKDATVNKGNKDESASPSEAVQPSPGSSSSLEVELDSSADKQDESLEEEEKEKEKADEDVENGEADEIANEEVMESPASPIDEMESPASPDEVLEEVESNVFPEQVAPLTEDTEESSEDAAMMESPASPDEESSNDEVIEESDGQEMTDSPAEETEDVITLASASKEDVIEDSPASPTEEQNSPASPDEVLDEVEGDEIHDQSPASPTDEQESSASPDEVNDSEELEDNNEDIVEDTENVTTEVADLEESPASPTGEEEKEEIVEDSGEVEEVIGPVIESPASPDEVIAEDDVAETSQSLEKDDEGVEEAAKEAATVNDDEESDEPLVIVEDQDEASGVLEESPDAPIDEDSLPAPLVGVVAVDDVEEPLVDEAVVIAEDNADVAFDEVAAPANDGVIGEAEVLVDDDDVIVEDDEHSPIRVTIGPPTSGASLSVPNRSLARKNTARKSTAGKRQRSSPVSISEVENPQQKKRRRREEEIVEVLDESREPSSPPEIVRSPEDIIKEILADVAPMPSDPATLNDEIVLDDDDEAPEALRSTIAPSLATISPEIVRLIAEATRPKSPDNSENIEIEIDEESERIPSVPTKRGPFASAGQPLEKRRKSADDSSPLSPASAFAASNKTADQIMEIARNQDQRLVRANPAMIISPAIPRGMPISDDSDDIQIIEDDDEIQCVGVRNHARPLMMSPPQVLPPRPLQGPTTTAIVREGAAINIGALKATTSRNVPPQATTMARPSASQANIAIKNPAPRHSLELPSTSAFAVRPVVPSISAPRVERAMGNGAFTPSSFSMQPSSSSFSRLSIGSVAGPAGRPSTSPNTIAALLQPIVPSIISPTSAMYAMPSLSSVSALVQNARTSIANANSRREVGPSTSATTPKGPSSSLLLKSSKPTPRNGNDDMQSTSSPISQTETIDLRDSSPDISMDDEPTTSTAPAKRLPQKKPTAKGGPSSVAKRRAAESSDEEEEPAKKRTGRSERKSPSDKQDKEDEGPAREGRRQLRARNNDVVYAENDDDGRLRRGRRGQTANRADEIEGHDQGAFMKMSSPRSPPRSIKFDKNGSMILPVPVPRRRRTDSTSSSKAADVEERVYNDLKSLSPTGITIREELETARGLNEAEKLFHELSLIEPFLEESEQEEKKVYILEKSALGRSNTVKRWSLASYQNCTKYSLDRTTMPDETFRSRKVCEVVAYVKETKPILLARLEPKESGPYKIAEIVVAVEFDLAYRIFPKSLNTFIDKAKKQATR